jgi:hypothetical protein
LNSNVPENHFKGIVLHPRTIEKALVKKGARNREKSIEQTRRSTLLDAPLRTVATGDYTTAHAVYGPVRLF